MFEVGFTEIILILGLALLVLGPERLPELAAKLGRWTGKARAMARQFQSQLEQEVTLNNISKSATSQAPAGSTYQSTSIEQDEPPSHSHGDEPAAIHDSSAGAAHASAESADEVPQTKQ